MGEGFYHLPIHILKSLIITEYQILKKTRQKNNKLIGMANEAIQKPLKFLENSNS